MARLEADFPQYHPVAALAEMIFNPEPGAEPLTNDQRIKIHSEIARYVEPTLKSVEHHGAGVAINIIVADVKDLA